MLVDLKDVAKEFDQSLRTIQNWCKDAKVKKIANEFQLTPDIVDQWRMTKLKDKTKAKTQPIIKSVAPMKRKSKSEIYTYIAFAVGGIIFTALVGYLIYQSTKIDDQVNTIHGHIETIKEQKTIISEKDKELNQNQSTIEKLKLQRAVDSTLINTSVYKRKTAY
jgi:cell division protein FtsL